MKKKNFIHSLPIALGILLLFSSCGDDKSAQQAQMAQQAPTLPVVSIPTKTVTAFTTYPASIEGIVNSQVNAKISGYITDVLVDEGQKVRKGQTLFRLETQTLSQDAAAARANVNAAQVEVDKLKPLVEKNIISNVQLETAKAKLQQAKSGYNSIAANIDYGNIKSPVDGYVGSINLRKGALVSPSSQVPMTTVSDISKVYAYFSMNEKEYLDFIQNAEGKDLEEKIKKLPKVQLLLANGSLYEEEGTIETINSQVNANTGSISFRAVFDNPSRILTNGNSGKIKIPKVYTDAVVVPQEATYEQQGSIYVYKVGEDGMATSTKIETTAEVGNLYVVAFGLQKGDKIVAKGANKLRGNSKINPQEMPFDSIAKPIEKVFR
ncbi:efflux RND transporter periplasmic adaptor subunit [Aequorivita vladivostokensis]|uniref:Secretion protein HlyD n=1 Tax=Aequorivita vladivostokensis TaxID=171194 RepID=A0ABR5DIG7_9FLAO|nr:efflux RND transporter periplasmic adaptor subunit [Aequorivita vladivostokensis]KJJ38566.1 secretion protein HlyD [Aequorivita vladivostokensis]MBF29958.1 efflux RND transporter periplasmic adaptor subunit [Aequorivita sp.]|tara:strand:- start:147286 stop:148422 length:1137 start_codon:yes stop_codon:yes gene_type:complete